ncbi:hypothetical protein G6F43_012571 [Rhizopus delemar]|nr:hypothetical protein G6F43_012571 [Rhizopus delemar]
MSTTAPPSSSSTISSTSQDSHYEIPEDGISPGGRLQAFTPYWKKTIHHPWPLSVIQEGYQIQWNSTPHPWKYHPTKSPSMEDRIAVIEAQTLLIPLLYCQGTDKEKTHIGLQTFEQIRPVPPLQDGRDTSFAITFGERRSHLQDRLERCIWNGIPIQVPSVWFKCSSQDLFQTHALCDGTIEEERDTTGVLFGRHMPGCEIDERNKREYTGNFSTPKEFRFSYQLQEEQPATTEDSRAFKVSIQHVQDDNRTSSTKIEKDCEQDPTSKENNDKLLMQMDSQSNWENDCNNSSNRRSITPPSIPTTRSSAEPSASSSKLGKPVPINKTKFRGSRMVGEICKDSQRPSNTQRGSQSSTSNRYLRRRLRQRVRDKQLRTRDSCVLDRSRTINFNKRKRIADSMDCIATARRKIQLLK